MVSVKEKFGSVVMEYLRSNNPRVLNFDQVTSFLDQEGEPLTINLQADGESEVWCKGLNEVLKKEFKDCFHVDSTHDYNPHITLFRNKTSHPIPNLSKEELAMIHSPHFITDDGGGEHTNSFSQRCSSCSLQSSP